MQSFAWLCTICVVLPTIWSVGDCSWGSPGTGQYHIQTDEGPERYFRFQTDNGQFRKEKRLQDGTVIGTEAWIDAAGFLRQKDYIADQKGYRILKSKTVFVGMGRQIEDAIKSTKSVPPQSGVLVDGSNGLRSLNLNGAGANGGYVYAPQSTTPLPVTSTSTAAPLPPRLGYLSPVEAAKLEKSPYLGFDHYPDELPLPPTRFPSRHRRPEPLVYVRPHSEPIDDPSSNSIADDYPVAEQRYGHGSSSTTERPLTAVPQPALHMQPPPTSHGRRLRPIAIVASTPSPISAAQAGRQSEPEYHGYSTPSPFGSVSSTTTAAPNGYHYGPTPTPSPRPTARPTESPASSYAGLSYDVNSLDAEGLLPPLRQTHYRRLRPRPLTRHNDIDPLAYDGVSVTQNGYRYVLPHQYHEDEQVDEQKRAGSFGYVDPFGIRRVVYYNASPERGFVHRNNNRYVGVGATPYDPPAV